APARPDRKPPVRGDRRRPARLQLRVPALRRVGPGPGRCRPAVLVVRADRPPRPSL
ncbi:MAG: hypothetical protein AVDCRST_MAG76-1339, partial [uncultured Acidimicrobiales bacterium]